MMHHTEGHHPALGPGCHKPLSVIWRGPMFFKILLWIAWVTMTFQNVHFQHAVQTHAHIQYIVWEGLFLYCLKTRAYHKYWHSNNSMDDCKCSRKEWKITTMTYFYSQLILLGLHLNFFHSEEDTFLETNLKVRQSITQTHYRWRIQCCYHLSSEASNAGPTPHYIKVWKCWRLGLIIPARFPEHM